MIQEYIALAMTILDESNILLDNFGLVFDSSDSVILVSHENKAI